MSESVPADLVSRTWEQPFAAPESIPGQADVVIIGGGIIGVSTAWFLARQGVNVVLCEKGHIAGEQSSRNWGWVRQQLRDTREMPMIVESLRIWRTLAEETGEDVGFREQGVMVAAGSGRAGLSASDRNRVKSTTAAASLNRLSPSNRVDNSSGAL